MCNLARDKQISISITTTMENSPAGPSQISMSSEDTTKTVVLSKKAQKRALKVLKLEERKIERRAKEKAAKKEKKRKRAERIAAGEQVEDESSQKRAKLHRIKQPFAARVVLDLGFDDKMNDKVRYVCELNSSPSSQPRQEITSLCSQLAYVYNTNRRSPNPFRSLLFTSLNGRTLSKLEKLNDAAYKRWAGTEWWSESYDKLWTRDQTVAVPKDGEEVEREDSRSDEKPDELPIPVSRDRVVYLTADSSEVLEELKEGETYIIGGICDHNRYKVCL
jgi:tRNA (guanine9-N1)-methyltransferase